MASYLQVENISKAYGPKVLFDNISFNINEGDKIALIAPNGTGKTSLLNILAGKDSSDAGGEIKYLRNIVTAFLEQDTQFDESQNILDAVISSVNLHMTMSSEWDVEISAKQVLTELGLSDHKKLISQLSGGERKRVALAQVLVQDADFILLDEPTNHLDLDAIEYLEEYLRKSRRTLFMVTHDRYFLDRVCNIIIEMDGGALYTYRGNYEYYLAKREERIANAKALTDKYRNLYRRELEWIRSTPCARTGKAKYRVDAFHELESKSSGAPVQKSLQINIESTRLGKKIINCKDLSFYYGERCMLKNFTYNFAPGEKIGIVGSNGIGKSTFLNLLTGDLNPSGGILDCGETVKFGYYRQGGIEFKEKQTVLETVQEIAESARMADGTLVGVTTFLQHFLFPVSMFNTRVEKLSGGERRRLYLLTVLMRHPNVLILDEPTNDLDIVTLNILEDYLKSFDGSVIIVSHDRYFLDKIVDHLFIFMPDGKVKDFVGSYSEYREYIKQIERERSAAKRAATPAAVNEKVRTPKKRLTYKEQKELESIELQLDALTKERLELETKLSSGQLNVDDLTKYSNRVGEILSITDDLELRWLELNEKIE